MNINEMDINEMDINETSINEINKPFQYLSKLTSGKIRESLCNILHLWYDIKSINIIKINNITNIVHTSSLIIDDIEDNSTRRRCSDCAHIKYGLPLSLNSAYLSIFKLMSDLDEKTNNCIINCLNNLHLGQGLDILWSNNQYIPSIKEYFYMVSNKTGSLFKLINNLGSLYGIKSNNKNCEKIFEKLGFFFQIRDDLCDIIDSNYWEKKGFFEDLNEGNMSYPIILCLNDKRDNYKVIKNMLGKKNSFFEKKKALNILINNNSIKDTTTILNKLKNEILLIDNRLNILIRQIYIPLFSYNKLLNFEKKYR